MNKNKLPRQAFEALALQKIERIQNKPLYNWHSWHFFTFLLLLLEKVSSARLRESDIDPISPKTPGPQYKPIDRKKRKGKTVEDYNRDRTPYVNNKALTLLLKPASSTTSNTGVQDRSRGTLRGQ